MTLNDKTIGAMVMLLRNYPANGKLPTNGISTALIYYRFVEEAVQEKLCHACGSLKTDYIYYRITPAGRAFLALADTIERANA